MKNWQIRQEALLPHSTEILSKKHVAVFGIGGVGSFLCETLARAGVGKLTLVDADRVSESNINRQLIADRTTVGRYKTEVMRDRITNIDPDIKTLCVNEFITPETLEAVLLEKPDFIADAVDTVALKLALAEYAQNNSVGIIASMGTGNKLHPELFEIADIYDTSVCPLCRSMRSRLKSMGIKKLPVVYSREEPLHVVAEESAGKHAPASVSFTPPAAGIIMTGYIIRTLLGME